MAQCPSCGTSVDVDFGMATCSVCALVFMVEMDGLATAPVGDSNSSENPVYSGNKNETDGYAEDDFEPTMIDSSNESLNSIEASEQIVHDALFDHEVLDVAPGEFDREPGLTSSPEKPDSEYSEHFLSDMSTEDSRHETDDTFLNSNGADNLDSEALTEPSRKDPLGLQKFDQTAASQMVDGPYYYDLTIGGLDTAEIKDQVLSALTDKRFQWTKDEIKKKFKDGQLFFKDLNPIKAVLLVIKMQHIDVDIEWTQKLHTDVTVGKSVTPR